MHDASEHALAGHGKAACGRSALAHEDTTAGGRSAGHAMAADRLSDMNERLASIPSCLQIGVGHDSRHEQ